MNLLTTSTATEENEIKELGPLSVVGLLALETIEKNLVSLPVLKVATRKGSYTVDTDVCYRQHGCVFLQAQEHTVTKLNTYWSQIL